MPAHPLPKQFLNYLGILKLSGLLLFLFGLVRIFFIVVNRDSFLDMTAFAVFKVCFAGILFDLNSIVFFNAILFLIISLPIMARLGIVAKSVKYLFITINSAVILFELSDAVYFRFSNRRASPDIFDIIHKSDFLRQLPHYIYSYWYAVIIGVILISILVRCYPDNLFSGYIDERPDSKRLSAHYLISALLAMNVISFYTDAGFGLKPLTNRHRLYVADMQNLAFSLNSTFSILNSTGKTRLPDPKLIDRHEAARHFNPVHNFRTNVPFTGKNVVIIILEGFARDFVAGYNGHATFAPFLKSLLADSVSFDEAYTGGFRTNDAVPAILSGIPVLMDTGYIDSVYSANHIPGLAGLLGRKGYHTAFFHGGKNGLFGLDYYAKLAGFNEYYGLNEYPVKSDYDGSWGVFDDPYLQYAANVMNRFRQPFMAAVLTVSSHEPYRLPPGFEGKFPKGPSVNCEAVGYADYALKRFFETAKHMPWYNNTLFVITADHPVSSGVHKGKAEYARIPLAFFSPGERLPQATASMIQHMDILPSVLDILHYDEPFFAFGKSAFDGSEEHCAYYRGLTHYAIYCGDYALLLDLNKTIGLYNHKSDPEFSRNIMDDNGSRDIRLKLETLLKSMIQTYTGRMNADSFGQSR